MELSEVPNSRYADFERLIPESPGDICFVFDVQSNQNNPDSDGDEYLDYEDGRYIYHIREVVTIFYGDNQTITMDTHSYIVKVDVDTNLRHHKIDTLRLSSCNNGNIDDPNNIARSYMNWGTIGED
ncbi:MAG: hypothetical protein K6F49_06575 [Saccharofermentans sp.]|nr:hypothetical protein [Saccharofermentans sp.]